MSFDPKILIALDKEKLRQKHTIELIASENFVSPEIMALTGSEFTNKYAEGLPGYRYYNGCEQVDVEKFRLMNIYNNYLIVHTLMCNHIVVQMSFLQFLKHF